MIDLRLLAALLHLRYRLLWATARSRMGKVTLLLVGYLFAVLLAAFLLVGGVGAAVAAARAGKTELVLRVVLGGFFLNAVLTAIILGVGVNPAFSDAALRRFPLRTRERFVARHVTAILDPMWLLVLAVDLGLAAGCAMLGVGPAWLALPAAVLLVTSNYLVAQVLVALVDRVMRTRVGRMALGLVVFLGVCLAPALPLRAVTRTPGFLSAAAGAATATPPLIAAAAMSSLAWRATGQVLALLTWCLALAGTLMALERWRPVARIAAATSAAWDTPHDRAAALFGSALAPLAGKMLRYLTRSPQVRMNTLLGAPSLVLLVVTTGHDEPAAMFPMALGGLAFIAGGSSGALYLNLFGFDGAGFRRYFLLPVSASRVLLVASVAVLLPGACFIPVALLLWVVYSPIQTDLRSLAMLASSGLVGLLLFPTIGVWTSVLAPTAIEFDRTWGNKLSLAANAVMVASIFCFFGFLLALHALGIGNDALVRHWWVASLLVLLTLAAYSLTIRVAGRVMTDRRERMLELIDPS
jgi:hypothetical protein